VVGGGAEGALELGLGLEQGGEQVGALAVDVAGRADHGQEVLGRQARDEVRARPEEAAVDVVKLGPEQRGLGAALLDLAGAGGEATDRLLELLDHALDQLVADGHAGRLRRETARRQGVRSGAAGPWRWVA